MIIASRDIDNLTRMQAPKHGEHDAHDHILDSIIRVHGDYDEPANEQDSAPSNSSARGIERYVDLDSTRFHTGRWSVVWDDEKTLIVLPARALKA